MNMQHALKNYFFNSCFFVNVFNDPVEKRDLNILSIKWTKKYKKKKAEGWKSSGKLILRISL